MLMDVDVINEGINSLIRAGYYESRDKLLDDAFRTMLEVRPTLKTEMAIELYKTEKISLSRAAEISETSMEGFKNILELRGIKRIVKAPSNDKIKKGVDLIIG
jgi:predicted HTH domain antitoxin